MSLKGFFQFILIMLLLGGSYVVFFHDGKTSTAAKENISVENDASYNSDISFSKQALSDVKTDLTDGKISERDANDRYQILTGEVCDYCVNYASAVRLLAGADVIKGNRNKKRKF